MKSNAVFFNSLSFLLVISICGIIVLMGKKSVELPYGNYNIVIYDNDDFRDMYTDEYLMALASAGDIKLAGIINSSLLPL